MIKFFLFSVFIFLPLNAQKLIHRVYSTDIGLVNGQVETIFEDSKGYMWFGTYGGASKWNGTSFQNFQLTDGLGSNQVFDIEEDNEGKIFFATYGAGVSILDNNKIYSLKDTLNFTSIWISCLYKNKKGEVYFGGIDGEIYEFKNNIFLSPSFKDKIPKKSIWDIYEASDGALYLATYGGGLVKIFNESVKVYTTKDGLLNDAIWSVKEDANGNIWLATSGGISILKDEIFSHITISDGLPGAKVYSLSLGKNGIVYAATELGGAIIDGNKITPITKKNGLPLDEMWEVFTDSRGIVFFGTGGEGFSCLFPEDVVVYNKSSGNNVNNFHTFIIDKSGSLLAGTEDGVFIFNQNKFENYLPASMLKGGKVNSLALGINNELFIATNKGLAVKKQNNIKWYDFNNGLPDNDVLLIKSDRQGNVYAATRKGAAVFSQGNIKPFFEKDGLKENYTRALYCSDDGEVYFGSFGKGIAILKDGKWDSLTAFHGLTDEHINTIYKAKNGTLLLGTYNQGLFFFYNNGSYKSIQEKDGLLSNTIISITEDKDGNFFIGTFKGISILYSGEENYKILNFTKSDGLPNNQGYRDAIILDSQNNLWYGTVSGAAKIPYKRLNRIPPSPIVSLYSFSIFENEIDPEKFLNNPVFNYDENYIKLEFKGVEYFSPEKIYFSYQLTGVDSSWVTSDRNFVQYTNLKYGDYTFNLKAMNAAGIWSDIYSISFIIKPAYWQTWWFIFLIILIVSGLIFFLIYYKLKQILAVEKFRSKIASDLHDNIGSGLSEISIMSEVIKYKYDGNKNSLFENIDKISETARRLVSSMSEVVWLANPNKDKLKDIISKLIDNYQSVCFELGISLNVNGLEFIENITFSLSDKHHLFLFIKEAVNNSIKYSKCTEINIKVKPENNLLLFLIEDNGIGFDENNIKKGYGLESMKMRSKELDASFNIISSKNNGTTITLILNKRKFNKLNSLIK